MSEDLILKKLNISVKEDWIQDCFLQFRQKNETMSGKQNYKQLRKLLTTGRLGDCFHWSRLDCYEGL